MGSQTACGLFAAEVPVAEACQVAIALTESKAVSQVIGLIQNFRRYIGS